MIDKAIVLVTGYIAGDPKLGKDINGEALIIQTLKKSGLVKEVTRFHIDALHHQIGDIGECLIHNCSIMQPNIVIFVPSGLYDIDPPRQAMDIITNRLGMKTVMARGDSVGVIGGCFTRSWTPFLSNIMFIDASLNTLGHCDDPKMIQGIISAGHSSYFCKKDVVKDIDVCFAGNVRMPRRTEYLDYLRNSGVNVHICGGEDIADVTVSWDDYVDVINRSKISLNFCMNGCGLSQMKGRVVETMACGTMFIEDEGIETCRFFEDGKDFVMVHGKEEMLEKIKYYLVHDGERESIAKAGYDKVVNLYTARNIWGYVFDKMGVMEPLDDESYRLFCSKMEELNK